MLDTNEYENIYIFPVAEIEEHIMSFIDNIEDHQKLICLNKYWNQAIIENPIYLEFKHFHDNKNLLTNEFDMTIKWVLKEKTSDLCAQELSMIATRKKHQLLFFVVCKFGFLYVAKYLLIKYPNEINIHMCDKLAFQLACGNGHIEIAKWLYQLYSMKSTKSVKFTRFAKLIDFLNIPTENSMVFPRTYQTGHFDIHTDNSLAFRWACCAGHLDITKWLYSLNSRGHKLDIHVSDDMPFKMACASSNAEVTKWVFSLDGKINLHSNNEEAFRIACIAGNLSIIKWLHSLDPTGFNIHAINEEAFVISCGAGRLDIIEYLFSLDKINIHVDGEKPFLLACQEGKLEIVKFLYQYSLDKQDPINVNVDDGRAFMIACLHNHLDIAKYLSSIECKFDMSFGNYIIFRNVCENNYLEMAQWLFSLTNIELSVLIETFESLYKNEHLEIAKWLLTLNEEILMTADCNIVYHHSKNNGQFRMSDWLQSIAGPRIKTREETLALLESTGNYRHLPKLISIN